MSARKLLPMTGEHADFLTLPFLVDREPTPDNPFRRAFWRDANTDDYGADNLVGAAWARRLLEYRARQPDSVSLLPNIVRDMVRMGASGGVEVGFLSTIEAAARARYRGD